MKQHTIITFLKKFNHISYIGDLFENNGKMRSSEDFRAKLDLDDNKKIYWRQIIHTNPLAWKKKLLE